MVKTAKFILNSVSFVLLFGLLAGCSQRPAITPDTGDPDPVERVDINPEALGHFMDGQLYLNQGNYALAVLEFQDALELDSLVSSIHVSLAESYWHLGKVEHSEAYLKKAINLDPSDIEAAEMLAHQYVLRKAYPEANKIYDGLWEKNPENIDYGYALANLAKLQDDLDRALKIYQQISREDEDNLVPVENAAQIALATQQYKLAQELFQTLVKLDSTNNNYLMTLSDLAILNGDFNTGINCLEHLLEVDNDQNLRIRLGTLYYEHDMTDKALAIFNKLYADSVDDPSILYFLSTIAAVNGDLIASEEYAEESIQKYPDEERGYGNRALIELQRDSVDKAIEILVKANEKIPANFTLKYLLGNSFYQKGEFNSARRYLEQALGVFPESRHARKTLALIYDSLKDWAKSDSLYTILVNEDINDAQTFNNYAYSLAERGELLDKALELSTQALQLEPDNSAYLDTMGWIYFKLGKYKKAQEYIQAAVDNDSTNAIVLEHLGDVFSVRKKHNQAREIYRKAWELDPDNERIKAKAQVD